MRAKAYKGFLFPPGSGFCSAARENLLPPSFYLTAKCLEEFSQSQVSVDVTKHYGCKCNGLQTDQSSLKYIVWRKSVLHYYLIQFNWQKYEISGILCSVKHSYSHSISVTL